MKLMPLSTPSAQTRCSLVKIPRTLPRTKKVKLLDSKCKEDVDRGTSLLCYNGNLKHSSF